MEVTTDIDLDGYEVVIECPRCGGTGKDPVVNHPMCKVDNIDCRWCHGEGFLEGPAHGEINDVPVEIEPMPVNEGYL